MSVDTSLRRSPTSRRAHKVNALTFSIMCKLMIDGTRSCQELAAESGLHVMTVYDWTATMHKQGIIHICDWEGEGRHSFRIFKFGPGKDVPRPIKSREQIHADYRSRQRFKKLLHQMAGATHAQTNP